MLRTRVLVSLAAFAAALALQACDGGSDEPGGLSEADFASKANALCAKTEAERARLLQQLTAPSGQSGAQTFRSLAGEDRELIRRVDALVPPEAEQDRVDRILDGWRQRAKLEESYATQTAPSLEAFTAEVAQIDATVSPIATELGMAQCTSAAS
jgi:hypothetical protein